MVLGNAWSLAGSTMSSKRACLTLSVLSLLEAVMASKQYANQVFVNCPFDEDYRPLFRAIVFTIADCGFVPRCALEAVDADYRLGRIIDLIRDCKYGVHDLSRVELTDGLPRFNMPFELGIFLGAKQLGAIDQRRKSAIVLDAETYRYQQFISDLAGADVRAHETNHHALSESCGTGLSPRLRGPAFRTFNRYKSAAVRSRMLLKRHARRVGLSTRRCPS